LSGSYDLRLAGLSSVTGVSSPSTWNPNQVNLNFYSLNLDNTVNMEETLQITDNTFINQTNTCGVTNNHDISYCFGEVLFPLVDSYLADTAYTAVSVSGSGKYTNTAGGVSYSTSFSAIGVVSNGNGSTTPNKGLFRLFLPQGPYTITTTVTKGGGTYNQPPVPIYVNCASSTFPTNQNSPVFSLTGLGNCYCGATTACATVNIINPTNDLMAVSYTINGGASVAVCTNCGITIPICFTLSPGANTIVITVTDLTTGFSTVLTQEVTCCQAPPIVTCPTNKAVQFGSGWTFDLPTASSCCGSNVTITLPAGHHPDLAVHRRLWQQQHVQPDRDRHPDQPVPGFQHRHERDECGRRGRNGPQLCPRLRAVRVRGNQRAGHKSSKRERQLHRPARRCGFPVDRAGGDATV